MKESASEVAQPCLTLCDPMDCSLPGSSVHGIFQARVLEWTAISFSREPSQPRDRTWVSCVVDRRFTIWATREAQYKISNSTRQHHLYNTCEYPLGGKNLSSLFFFKVFSYFQFVIDIWVCTTCYIPICLGPIFFSHQMIGLGYMNLWIFLSFSVLVPQDSELFRSRCLTA